MSFFLDAFAYILDGANWPGPDGIGARILAHLLFTAIAVGIGIVIAVPLGVLIGHTGRGRGLVVATTGAARALPTFGALLLLVLLFGLGPGPLVVVLVVLAVPPLLAGVYAGIEAVDRATIDAARAIGMTEPQILGRVEIPLALPLAIGGLRSAVLQVIATATIAGYVAEGGLGRYLIEGLALHEFSLAIVGALLVTALALLADGALAALQRAAVPRGLRVRPARRVGSRRSLSPARPITEG